MIPRATYRLQFHAGFTFADAEAIVPYLHDLGISHIYASPLTEAREGSTHGYDVIDPARISAVLGGEGGLRRLVTELLRHDMGMILDIVPNHLAASPQNRWWADVLQHGQASAFAGFFDIDWSRHGGKILLPVLGHPLDQAIEQGDIVLECSGEAPVIKLYGEQFYPLAPGSEAALDIRAVLEAQHYRLAWWRLGHDELNWRRFFSISELAGLRMENEAAFDAVHDLPLRLYREGVLDGLRIDHVDGLSDPEGYLIRLRDRLDDIDREREGGPAWLVVEKILGPGESLPATWPVDGTTGYEFMDQVSQLLHEQNGEAALTAHWNAMSGRPTRFEEEELLARRQMLHWEFTAQLEACIDALAQLAAQSKETAHHSRAAWARALETVLLLFPVYRTYGTGTEASPSDERVRRAVEARLQELAAPGEAQLARTILEWLAGKGPAASHAGPFVRRLQQLSAPIAAKAVEDTAFYRYGRLLSRNDVGFDANAFSVGAAQFHAWQEARQRDWPRSMLTTATHDHKRGEDVRARMAAISGIAEDWITASNRWIAQIDEHGQIDRGDLYMLLQVLVGAWPERETGGNFEDYAERLRSYARKALREAKLRSSWTSPDEAYENRLASLIDRLLLSLELVDTRESIGTFVSRLAPSTRVKQLAQTFLRNTCPGVPDLYQGAEFADLSLVDPDNRRPVDFAARRRALQGRSVEKQRLIRDLLTVRERHPQAFAAGYRPIEIKGEWAECLIGFERGEGASRLLMVAGLRLLPNGNSPSFDASCIRGLGDMHLPGLNSLRLTDLVNEQSSLLEPGLPCAIWQIA